MNKSLLFLLSFLMMAMYSFSQPTFTLQGTIKNFKTGRKVSSGTLMLYTESGDSLHLTIMKGKFKTEVPLGEYYTIRYSNSGIVTQKIAVDAGIDCKEEKIGKLSVELFRIDSLLGMDFGLFEKSISTHKFSCENNKWHMDNDYDSGTDGSLKNFRNRYIHVSQRNTADEIILIYGETKNVCTDFVVDAKVTLIRNSLDTISIDKGNGYFEVIVRFDGVYQLVFSKEGFATKSLEINALNVPIDARIGGQGFDLDIGLVPVFDGVDYSVYDKLIGKAMYQSKYGGIAFDEQYTTEFMKEEYTKLKKDIGKDRCPMLFDK